ncbi:MAG: hypothetical protein IAF38_15690 [Bacteroidia bacterium]|nr:hypothetical protein [Bacteroidia bacterium]
MDELLTAQREKYVVVLHEALKKAQLANPNTHTEAMLAMTGGDFENLPYTFQKYVVDILRIKPDGSYGVEEINLDSQLDNHTHFFDRGLMKISISPFYWNGCLITLDRAPNDWEVYYSWIEKWFDHLQTAKSKEGLSGLIHNSTFPQKVEANWEFSLDLGSSSIDALNELFDLMSGQGILNLKISSENHY